MSALFCGSFICMPLCISCMITNWVFVFMSITYVISMEVRDAYVRNLQMPCRVLLVMM